MMSGSGRLLGLEAGRFAAALLVACFHFSIMFVDFHEVYVFDMAFRAGHAGVEYFFVLSGFIIYYIHRSDLGVRAKLRDFAVKRAIRLYPMYLAVFAALLAAFALIPSLGGDRDLSPGSLVLDALLLPMNGSEVLAQSWSLRHEVVFYAIFSIAILNARAGVAALVAWQLGSLVFGLLYPSDVAGAVKPFLYLHNIGFGMGIFAAWASFRWQPRRPGLIALAGLTLFIAAMVIEWKIGRYVPVPGRPLGERVSPIIYLSCSALIIFGVTQMEKVRALPFGSLLKVLGGASYALYLVHTAVGSVLIRVFQADVFRFLSYEGQFVLMVLVAICISVVAHLAVEKPLLAFLRSKLLKRSNRRVVTAVAGVA